MQSAEPLPAAMPEAAATRTTQQQLAEQQPERQLGGNNSEQLHGAEQQQQFLVWVGVAAEAASAFEASNYAPRRGLAPLWLPPALERLVMQQCS